MSCFYCKLPVDSPAQAPYETDLECEHLGHKPCWQKSIQEQILKTNLVPNQEHPDTDYCCGHFCKICGKETHQTWVKISELILKKKS